MEQVYPVESGLPLIGAYTFGKRMFSAPDSFKVGTIERILEPGHFIVTVGSNSKVEAKGSGHLKIGTRVRLSPREYSTAVSGKNSQVSFSDYPVTPDIRWMALMPLGFGGKDSFARLEVFADRGGREFLKKNNPAVYFIFTIVTENQGEIQWYIHLKNSRISIQIYAKKLQEIDQKLKCLVRELETSLKVQGFIVSAPTIFLRKPIRVSATTRLNLRG